MTLLVVDESLVKEASELDASLLNRSNIAFSRLSMKIAESLLQSVPLSSLNNSFLSDLEETFQQLAMDYNNSNSNNANNHETKPPFCVVEGVKYALNAYKMSLIANNQRASSSYILVVTPFYCEFERGMPSSVENPNGEESPIQKLEESLFLLQHCTTNPMSMELLFVNDVIAEKTDHEQGGGSSLLFQKAILDYLEHYNKHHHHPNTIISIQNQVPRTDGIPEGFSKLQLHIHNKNQNDHPGHSLYITFTSCEQEIRDTDYESATEKRQRMENRDLGTNKLQERKGGAVLTGMEWNSSNSSAMATVPKERLIRCLVDGDSAHPMGSFVGDAAYAILECDQVAYLGNLKHPCTCISTGPPPESSAIGSPDTETKEKDATSVKIQNRKLLFSGFIVPFLFPELADTYNYRGTIQLPIKAFRADINFAQAKLRTVQPNVDLGMLGLLCSHLNTGKTGTSSIGSGAVTIRDNVASSTMTTSDLESEWNKTYVSLCRELKPNDFSNLDPWWTNFMEHMELRHYVTLFGEDATSNDTVVKLFQKMKEFSGATDRGLVLDELKRIMQQIFVD